MRRATAIVFFACLLVVGLVLFVRLARRPTPVADKPLPATAPAKTGMPKQAPRLAQPTSPTDDQGAKAEDEEALMEQLRKVVKGQPSRAEALAREARRRFPDGDYADERDALLVYALVNQQRIGPARDETYYYYDHHPEGKFAHQLFVMTGVHKPPKRP
jgi:ClpP class serine protease